MTIINYYYATNMIDWNMNRQIMYNQDMEYATSAQIDANKFQQLEQEKQKLEQWRRKIAQRVHEWATRAEQYRLKLLPEPSVDDPTIATILVKFTSVSLTGIHHTYRRRFALDASALQLLYFVFSSGMVDDPNVVSHMNNEKNGLEMADIIDNVDIMIRDAVGTIQYTLANSQCNRKATIRDVIGDKNIALVVVQEPVITQPIIVDLTND